MLSKVHGIMFFSTPHKGSIHARTLNNILSVVAGSSSKIYVSELSTSSTSIEDISEQFRTTCGQLQLVSLYENKPTKLVSGVKKLVGAALSPFGQNSPTKTWCRLLARTREL